MENFKINTTIGNSDICIRDVTDDSITPNISNQQFSQFGSNGQISIPQYVSSTSSLIQTNHSGIPDISQISSSNYNNMNASCTSYVTYSNSGQQFCDPPQQFYNPTHQSCNPTQFCKTQRSCGPSHQFYNPTHQFCDSPHQFCNPTRQFCDPPHQFCNPTRQFCDPTQRCNTQQSYNPTHCSPSHQFCNPTRQFCDPPHQFCNPTSQFCDSPHQFCNPTRQQQPFSYEISGYMPADNQQSTNVLMNDPQFDTNGHILPLQSAFDSFRILDNNPQNNCNCVNNSLLSYAMSSNYGQQFSTIICPQHNQSYSPSQQQHNKNL